MSWAKSNPAMVAVYLQEYLLEIIRQTTYARDQVPPLLRAVNERRGHDAFGHLASLLHFTSQAYWLVWPSGKSDRLRGRWVRVALGMPSKQTHEPTEKREQAFRKLRNAVAHLDEMMDKQFANRVAGKTTSSELEMPNRLYAEVPRFDNWKYGARMNLYFEIDPHRTVSVSLCGKCFKINDLDSDLADIYGRAETALDERRYLDILTASGLDINKAEALVFGTEDSQNTPDVETSGGSNDRPTTFLDEP